VNSFFYGSFYKKMNRGEIEEIVQNTVRKMNSGPEACLTNPRVLSFFNMMKDSITRTLTASTAASTTTEDKAASFRSIQAWDPERQQDEVNSVLKRYPSIKDAYTYSAVYIVEQTYKKENRQLKLKLPSFQQFLVTFYNQVLSAEPLQRGTYDELQFFEKEMLCCQAFCNALYNSIRTEPVERQQSVIVEERGSTVPSSTKKSTAAKSAVASQIASASRFSMRALSPHDSVSQMARPSSTSANALANAGSLTEDTLNRHRSKMGQEQKTQPKVHPAEASAASVFRAANNTTAAASTKVTSKPRKESVRVVDVVEHPQKHLVGVSEDDLTTTSSSSSSSASEKSYSRKKLTRDPRRLDRDFEREYLSQESTYYERPRDRSDRDRDWNGRDRDRSDRNPNRRH
jgi:hypothetical protein